MTRRKVVLYNPWGVFWTMPLALLAVGSALDPTRYEVTLVDGRLEVDPIGTLSSLLDNPAVCLGMTVLTGSPIRDALRVSRAIKTRHPKIPIIWGGWHPSLFPEQCLSETCVDAVVVGQGELTFTEVVERLADDKPLNGVAGCHFKTESGKPVGGPPRPLSDINLLPAHNYHLVPVEDYFLRKGKRQLDYVSSQGCRFRCSFCADPAVFKRSWSGLAPERIARELLDHSKVYGIREVAFQDETFFTGPERVGAIAEAFLHQGLAVDWTATLRSDQGSRLDDSLLALCKRSGLKRVMIGVESGSPETLRRIHKDITIEQVFQSAEKCARHGIGAILNFIVGFPGESDEAIGRTLDVAARLRAMSPDFETSIFYFRPFPGTELALELDGQFHNQDRGLEIWADFDYIGGRGEGITDEQWRLVERFKFYQRHAFARSQSWLRRPLKSFCRWRVDRKRYGFPWEKWVVERIRPARKLS